MKIISKYKDYYDYISGIYGEDPLIVLDRSDFSFPDFFGNYRDHIDSGTIKVYIGGYLIEGFYYDKKIYYGDDLLNFGKPMGGDSKRYSWVRNFQLEHLHTEYNTNEISEKDIINIHKEFFNWKYRPTTVLKKMIIDNNNVNEKENCPIVVIRNNTTYKNCILKDLYLNNFIPPEEIYKMISDWISLQITKKENKIDTRTDLQKIIGKGFDKITSFRGK